MVIAIDGDNETRLCRPINTQDGEGVTFRALDGLRPFNDHDLRWLWDTASPAVLDLEATFQLTNHTINIPVSPYVVPGVPCYSINEEYSHDSGQDLTSDILGYVIPHINLAEKCVHSEVKENDGRSLFTGTLDRPLKRLPHGIDYHVMCIMRLACKELYHLTIDYFEQFVLFNTVEIWPNRHALDICANQFPYRGVTRAHELGVFKSYIRIARVCEKCGGQTMQLDQLDLDRPNRYMRTKLPEYAASSCYGFYDLYMNTRSLYKYI